MRPILYIALILFAISCKPGNDPIPNHPLPPIDSSNHTNFGKLIFFSDTFRVYDASTGKLLTYTGPWTATNGAGPNTLIDSNFVYQPNEDHIIAMNLNTGTPAFSKKFDLVQGSWVGVSPCYPVINGPYLYQVFYNDAGSALYCLNKRTGDIIWTSNVNLGFTQDRFFSTIDQTSQNIIVTGIFGPACFSKATGNLIWQNDSSYEYAEFASSPTVCTEDIVVFVSSKTNSLYGFDTHNGALLWKLPIALPSSVALDCKPYLYDNKLFIIIGPTVTSPGEPVIAIDFNTGKILYQFNFPKGIFGFYYDKYFYVFEGAGPIQSNLTLSKHLLTDGTVLWSKTVNGPLEYGMVATPGFLYYTVDGMLNNTGPRKIDILDQATGNLLREYPVYVDELFFPTVLDSLNNAYYQVRY